jgi:hypothetical protein
VPVHKIYNYYEFNSKSHFGSRYIAYFCLHGISYKIIKLQITLRQGRTQAFEISYCNLSLHVAFKSWVQDAYA